jgi:general secretion pathway protein N
MRWKLLAAGLGFYAIALIVTAPATLIDAILQDRGGGSLRLDEAQGTLWTGSGQLEIRDAGGRSGIAKSIAWRVLPASLLRGHLVCEVELDQAARSFPVTISLSRVELADADINLPVAALGLAVPTLAPLELTGEVQIHLENVAIERSDMRGKVTLQWRAAGSALTSVAPLGDYELRIDAEQTVVSASLRTLQGPLQLDGKGTWTLGDKPVMPVTARVSPEYRQELVPLLRLIATERGDDSFELQLK